MNEVEGLIIYKGYMDLIYYTEMVCEKFPKSERFCLVSQIKNATYEGMKKIIEANKEYNKIKRLEMLNSLDTDLKMIKVLIRVANKRKYIKSKNYGSWSRKLANVGNMLGGWISTCLKA